MLVAMLVQADRFGNQCGRFAAGALGSLRTKRRQRAEEAAAKIPLSYCFR